MYNEVVSPAVVTYPVGVARRIEFVLSEAEVYGNWTMEDFVFHFDGLTFGEMEAWLDELISEGDAHLDGLM